jgi:hypothetical protein
LIVLRKSCKYNKELSERTPIDVNETCISLGSDTVRKAVYPPVANSYKEAVGRGDGKLCNAAISAKRSTMPLR